MTIAASTPKPPSKASIGRQGITIISSEPATGSVILPRSPAKL